MSAFPPSLNLRRASDLEESSPSTDIIKTLTGRLVEIGSGSTGGALTAASLLIRKVQQEGQDAAWISATDSLFFPPDFAANGIDLSRIPIVRTASIAAAAHAAGHLLRSGAFRLIVLDVGKRTDLSLAHQGRLIQLAGTQHAVVLFLTDRECRDDRSSFGSLISLHGIASHAQKDGERFRLSVRVTKDKRRGPGWMWQEVCHGPVGLC